MSFAQSVSAPSQSERRSHARRRLEGLVYVDFGSDNGAILIDLGEGGLGFQSVIPVSTEQSLLLKFKLPGEAHPIEGHAEVAWVNESSKGGGLRFVELSADARAHIRGWTGVSWAPEAGASQAGSGTNADSAQEGTAQEEVKGGDIPAQISEAFAGTESAQAAGLSPETNPALPVAEAAGEQTPAEESDLPDASPVPEFAVEVAAASDVSRGPAGVVRAPESTPGISKPAPAVAAKAARVPASDLKHLEPVQKRKGKPSTSKPEPFVPPGEGQDSTVRGLFPRQSQKPAPASTESENLPGSQGEELKPTAILASQALRIGMGAAAGAALVLALVVGVPFLRTAVQATANARSAASNPASSPAFQVEVADLNDRRWILTSGGEAGSPLSNAPSRRETQSASSAARNESAKPPRSNDSGGAGDTAEAPPSKLPSPGVLALSRPHPKQAEASSAQLIAPSIFDGITPPIGSLSDRLPASGPAAPGVVQPESQSGVRNSALQSAVLLQRVAPIYPSNALQSRLQGQVLVNATIGRDGIPKDLKIIKGDERLVAAALAAIRQWRYRPAMLGGQPIETQTVVTISFEIK
jgi:protein TonB